MIYCVLMTDNDKPIAAFALSLVAGILILVWGLLEFFGLYLIDLTYEVFLVANVVALVFGIVPGILVIIGSLLLYVNPQHRTGWSLVILIFSIMSILSLGGFIVGLVLGIIGGALGLRWKPGQVSKPTVIQEIKRICPKCGRVLAEDVSFCPYCGKSLE